MKFFLSLRNARGVALILVLTAIALLTTLLVEFTFDVRVNKLKVQNSQDRIQARLNALSGLKLAVARLRLYKEAYNLVQKNQNLKDVISPPMLDQLWSVPFVYPLPLSGELNIIQKAAVEEFSSNMLLKGSFQVSIQNVSHRLNLNILRKLKKAPSQEEEEKKEEDKSIDLLPEISNLLKKALEEKREKDEEFNDKYGSVNTEELLSHVQYFISDKDSYDAPLRPYSEKEFQTAALSPKHGPLSSLSELSLLPGWQSDIIDLIENDFNVHGSSFLDINRLTDHLLTMIFPSLDEAQRKEFFNYRDNPDNPQTFNSLEDFKTYLTKTTGFLSEETFTERVTQWKNAGLNLGSTAFLFKVIISAAEERGVYNLSAYVLLPITVTTPKAEKKNTKKTDSTTQASDGSNQKAPENAEPTTEKEKEPSATIELEEPRVVEIILG